MEQKDLYFVYTISNSGKMRYLLATIFVLAVNSYSQGQEVLQYLYEDFEDSEKRALWSSIPADPIIKWEFQDGGDNSLPPGDYQLDGNYNAFFSWFNFSAPEVRTLVSPLIDLSDASRPQLTFAHAQHYQLTNQDELYLLFKAGESADWDTITHYTGHVYPWTERFFNIEEYGQKYLVEDFQLGFMAVGKGGNGVVVDSIVIEEKDIIPKYVRKFEVEHVNHSYLPTGIQDAPIMKIYIEVFGNSGSLDLNSIVFNSLGTSDADFPANGFNLYHTSEDLYKNSNEGNSNQVGSSVSISSGDVSFSGLSYTLSTGDNYLWLTADIDVNAVHNNIVDFQLATNSISVSDTTFPDANVSPSGSFSINESIFFDSFETLKGWTLEGDFEIDTPQGFQINIARDPDYAYGGGRILGTDLRTDGGYTPGILPGTAYAATTPSFNLTYFKNIKLYAQKWLSFSSNDDVTIDVSVDGGANWTTIWERKFDLIGLAENGWSELLISDKLNEVAATQSDVRLRLLMNETHESYVLGGWNLDNFAILGNHLTTDVGITSITSPYNDCIGKGNDDVTVTVRNYAQGATPTDIPIYFSLEGYEGARVYDTIPGPIAQDGSVTFTFTPPADFPAPGEYDFIVGLDLPGDEDALNDTMSKPIFIQNSLSVPLAEDFEDQGGFWVPSEESNWACVTPTGGVPVLPESPNSWFVAPTGVYLNNDTSWIISSCYDLTGDDVLVIDMNYWTESEVNTDGATIQFSSDGGNNWTTVDSSMFGYGNNWYSETVSALGDIGWSGNTTDWKNAREYLPASLISEPNVKFRILWASNESSATGRGFVFDDFSIYEAPQDVGVSNIVSPVDACQLINDGSVVLEVTNFGVNSLKTNDTLIVGFDLDANAPVIDTIIMSSDLLPGNSIQLTFDAQLDLSLAKSYTLSAYTLIEADPEFYGTSNDTLSTVFNVWPNPVPEWADTIFSRNPKTETLRPYSTTPPGYSFLWYDGSTNDYHNVDVSDVFYNVSITEPDHLCQIEDSVYVQLLFYDVGASSVAWPRDTCELTSSELIEVYFKNKGTDSIGAGRSIDLKYTIVPGDTVTNTYVLTEPLLKGDSLVHIFSQPFDFSSYGEYTITVITDFSGDTVTTNDAVSNTISVFGYTPLELGTNITVQSLSYVLDAGSDFDSYLWSTGDTTQTTLIENSGLYWVDAFDANGCPGNDTVDVFLKIRDVKIDTLVNPMSSCDRVGPESMQIQISNNGTDTISTSDVITVDYRLDGGSVNEETVVLSADLLPGAQYIHTFSTTEDVSAYTSYLFEITARTPGDLRTTNDSMTVAVETVETPIVDLGGDQTVNGYQIVLDAGAGTNYAYLWNDNSTNQTLTATTNGKYWVSVTNTLTGCSASDTVLITFDITDYAVQSFGIEDNPCAENYENVEVKVLNNGNNIRNNAVIKVGFFVGTEDPIVEEYTVEGVWLPLQEASISLTSPIQLASYVGSTDITVYLDQVGDLNPGNDVLTRTVNVREAPIVPIDGDTINTSLPYTIDATSPGDDNFYQWGDNTVGPTFVASVYGEYTVYVRTSNGCETVAHVWIDVPSFVNEAARENLEIELYPNPVQDMLIIDAELKTGDEFVIEIYDVTNKIVFSEEHKGFGRYENKIDVSGFGRGLYFVRLRNKEIYFVKQIIVN